MSASPPYITLNSKERIPSLGLGTWQSKPGEVRAAVAHAIEAGYRHIDAAYCYGNEAEVGQGIKDGLNATKLKREDLFVTTKLWCTYHTRVEIGLAKSLELLGLDYVDLYLMHWPVAMNPNGNDEKFPRLADGSRDLLLSRRHVDTYKDMEKLLKTGKVKSIGVANYSVGFLEDLLAATTIVPAVNQIENHPLLPQQEIVEFCKAHGIHVTAYSPLGSTGSPLFEEPEIKEVAKRRGVNESTVLLSWHVTNGRSVLAKSVTPSRITSNLNIIDLMGKDLQTIAKLTDRVAQENSFKRYVYPAFGVNFGFPDKQTGVSAAV